MNCSKCMRWSLLSLLMHTPDCSVAFCSPCPAAPVLRRNPVANVQREHMVVSNHSSDVTNSSAKACCRVYFVLFKGKQFFFTVGVTKWISLQHFSFSHYIFLCQPNQFSKRHVCYVTPGVPRCPRQTFPKSSRLINLRKKTHWFATAALSKGSLIWATGPGLPCRRDV